MPAPTQTAQTSSDPPPINVLTALQTVYKTPTDPTEYISRASAEISTISTSIIDTLSKHRIRLDDNLYSLLDTLDTLSETSTDLSTSSSSAQSLLHSVDTAKQKLTQHIIVRANLDAALAVAATTRRLTRMYARIEDTIDARRLYTAHRMLQLFQTQTEQIKPGTVLNELIPDPSRLRARIVLHARKNVHAWLTLVRRTQERIGAYALHVESAEHKRLSGQDTNGTLYVQQSRDKDRTNCRVWTPRLTSNPPGGNHVSKSGRIAGETGLGGDMEVETGGARWWMGEYGAEEPQLYLRPLLQSALVNEEMDLMGDMRAEYRRERGGQLIKMLDTGKVKEEESRAREVQKFVFRVCGFFVVERAVERHLGVGREVVNKGIVDGEWWNMAIGRVRIALKRREETIVHSPAERASVRGLMSAVERFARANGFST